MLLDFVLLVFGLLGFLGFLGISRCVLPALVSCHLVCIGVVVCPWFSQFPIPSCLCFSRFFLFHFPWVRLDLYSVFCVLSFFPTRIYSFFYPLSFLFSCFCRLLCVYPLWGMGVIEFHCLSPSCPALSLRFRVSFSQSHWLFNTDKWK